MGRDTTFGWISLGGLNLVPVKVPCPSPSEEWCGRHGVCISKLDLETKRFGCSISFDFPMNDWNIDFSSSIALLVAYALATTLLNSPFRSACDFSIAAILAASPVVSPCGSPFLQSPKKNEN